ncbi:MAG TPA: polysaccharide biosynthesis C-terminal domain-containing protein, partial [Candidatus Eisenbacteria bacterium]
LAPLLPAHAHLDATGDHAGVERLYLRSSRTLLAIAMPLAAAVVALAPALCTVWLGPGHDDAGWAACAIAGLLWVNVLTSAGCMVARGTGRAWIEARYQLLSMAIHLPLALIWIPRLGFGGGLAALIVSGTAGTLYFLWAFHRALGLPWWAFAREVVAPPALASALAAAAAWWTSTAIGGSEVAARGPALAGLAAGAGVFTVIALAILFATRYVTVSGLRVGAAGLARALRGASGDAMP